MHRHHVDAKLAKGGGWIISGRRRDMRVDRHEVTSHDEKAVAAYRQQYLVCLPCQSWFWVCCHSRLITTSGLVHWQFLPCRRYLFALCSKRLLRICEYLLTRSCSHRPSGLEHRGINRGSVQPGLSTFLNQQKLFTPHCPTIRNPLQQIPSSLHPTITKSLNQHKAL